MEDSRAKRLKTTHPTLPLERTYCVNCGRPKGWVSVDSFAYIAAQQIIVICDDCVDKFGAPGLVVADIKEY